MKWTLLILLLGGCRTVIDLGPETDAGPPPVADATPPDADPTDASDLPDGGQ